jgi:predicted KAP-like P-loop ATPase
MSDTDISCTPPDIRAAALATIKNLLPEKSQTRYNNSYNDLKEWCKTRNVTKITENVLLVYFQEKSQNYKSSTLWSLYSMVKTTVNLRDNVDISKFPKLISFLKRKNVGYTPKKIVCLKYDPSQFIPQRCQRRRVYCHKGKYIHVWYISQ